MPTPTQSKAAAGEAAQLPTPSKPWFVGNGIRASDTAGICVAWNDGGETGEETIAEVLPTTDSNKTRDKQAAFIVRAANNFDSLITLARNVANEQTSPHRKQALEILSRI